MGAARYQAAGNGPPLRSETLEVTLRPGTAAQESGSCIVVTQAHGYHPLRPHLPRHLDWRCVQQTAVEIIAILKLDRPGNERKGNAGLHRGENGGRVTPSTLAPATVRPEAATGLARAYGGTPISVTTFHYDNGRTGWNASETDLTALKLAGRVKGILQRKSCPRRSGTGRVGACQGLANLQMVVQLQEGA